MRASLVATRKSFIGLRSSWWLGNASSYALNVNPQVNQDGFNPFIYSQLNNGRCATHRIFQSIGSIHDLEVHAGLDNIYGVNTQIFISHWSHLSIIALWLSGTLFHIGWNGNYQLWISNPISYLSVAHGILDQHFGLGSNEVYSSLNSDDSVVLAYSGVYNILLTIGIRNSFQIYQLCVGLQIIALFLLLLAQLHLMYFDEMLAWFLRHETFSNTSLKNDRSDILCFIRNLPLRLYLSVFDSFGLRLNYHIGVLFGFSCIAWSGHLIHVSIPSSRGVDVNLYSLLNNNLSLDSLLTGNWSNLAQVQDSTQHIFGQSIGSGSSILSFIGGLNPNTCSLYLTDIAHHHLAIGILCLWSSHIYSSLIRAFSHKIRNILLLNSGSNGGLLSLLSSEGNNIQLSLALGSIACVTGVVSIDLYSLPAYAYISYGYVTTACLYIHHSWISSILMLGCFAHLGIFLVRDYYVSNDQIFRILSHRAAIVSHLSFICLFLGFHTLGIYTHNDVQLAFGQAENQLLIEPVFAQLIQQLNGKYIYGSFSDYSVVYFLNKYFGSLMIPLGSSDLLAHHSIALGLHVTALILVKGALDGSGSRLVPDKLSLGYGFACDGPGRGGTCDVSSWDSFYLGSFWMLNSNAWILFYFHFRYLGIAQNIVYQFEDSGASIIGWFRDYLWFNSAPVVGAYDSMGANDVSVWSWVFLASHLCWATGFMFLISWRGYWQELIDVVVFMHQRSPILYDLWGGAFYSPVALSIVQARFIGLIHFCVGFILTYASFVICSTS